MLYLPVSNDANGVSASLRHDIHPVKTIKAHSLAHFALGTNDRAWLGRKWVDGNVIVVPTVKLASHVFSVSEQLIARMKRTPSTSMSLGCLAWGWLKSSKAERVAFAAEYEAELWAALEHVTDH